MELFDKASEIITTGSGKKSSNAKAKGKIRKGAMMGVLDVWHPDIIEFITAKQQAGRLSKFNISVNCTDEFMRRVNAIHSMEKALAESNGATATTEFQEDLAKLDSWDLIFPDTLHWINRDISCCFSTFRIYFHSCTIDRWEYC
jgi:ribonucleotide reductase alpha subunit